MKHLYLIFIATFILGFLSGVLVYIQSHTGKEGDGSLEETVAEYVVTGTRYTNSGNSTLSYRIAEGGSYTLIERTREGEEKKYEGVLPREERQMLDTMLSQTDFETLLDTTFTDVCPITTGGFAYRYGITYHGSSEYIFDSCKQAIENSPLFVKLNQIFLLLSDTYSVE